METAIYEERRTVVAPDRLDEYLALRRSELRHIVEAAGGETLCLLSGLIGNPQNELVQITAWHSVADWTQAQGELRAAAYPQGLYQSEQVRLLTAISERPKPVIPAEDRRPVYGFRRFHIRPSDIGEFVHCSENGIWPRIESMGACILGLWTPIGAANPTEIVLATGYHSPSHWEQTRYEGNRPAGVDKALWDNENALRRRRVEMSIRSWVCLMRAHDVR